LKIKLAFASVLSERNENKKEIQTRNEIPVCRPCLKIVSVTLRIDIFQESEPTDVISHIIYKILFSTLEKYERVGGGIVQMLYLTLM
jgi:hypothetical protein